jgi:acyl CoA:acetate/3-ketoacid CoA transferase alpha subunit
MTDIVHDPAAAIYGIPDGATVLIGGIGTAGGATPTPVADDRPPI